MRFIIAQNVPAAKGVRAMRLEGDTREIRRPGQFVQVQVPGFYLRRPISVCDWDEQGLLLVYKVVGEGTAAMARMQPGEALELLTGLGNGFDPAMAGQRPLLVGGGVGLPPLLGLAKTLVHGGVRPLAAAGFGTEADVMLREEFRAAGVELHIATMDGSLGVKGLVTDAMRALAFDSVFACGPLPMLRAVYDAAEVPGQFSFEERMGCGFGACMGCTLMTRNGPKRVCADGPVFRREEILWNS